MIKMNKKGIEESFDIVIMLLLIAIFILIIIFFSIYENPFSRTAKAECSLEYAELSTSLNQVLSSKIQIENKQMTVAEYIASPYFYKSSVEVDDESLKIILHEKLSSGFFLQPYTQDDYDWKFSIVRPYKSIRSYNPGSPGWDTIFEYAEIDKKPFDLHAQSLQINTKKSGPEVFQAIPTPTKQQLFAGLQVFIPNYKECR